MKTTSRTWRAAIITLVFVLAMISPLTNHAYTPPARNIEPANARSRNTLVIDDPEAVYEGARIVHNVTANGRKGMRVHAKFQVKYGKDVACQLIAYFYYDDSDNTPLKAGDENYQDAKGNVSAHTNFTPGYDPAVYNDLQIFIPYDALNMESGDQYDLKFYLALYDKEGGRFFGKSGWYKFHLTMP
ncbi:MAG: hypothetical protein ABR607_06080 [Pyrinomonadaceae bacterium]